MASFYGRRSNYVAASWIQPRLYPRQEPVFDAPSTLPPLLTRATSRGSHREPSNTGDLGGEPASTRDAPEYDHPPPPPPSSDDDAQPRQPPPLYFPGEAQLARQRTRMGLAESLPPGTVPSTNVLSSRTATVRWLEHPTRKTGWKRYIRVNLWYNCLVRQQREQLWDGWPVEFGGQPIPSGAPTDVETGTSVTRMTSRRSGASAVDSGIALTPRGTIDCQHPLEPQFRHRIDELNELIPRHLAISRVYLSLLEMINYTWLAVLIVALAAGGGKQTGFLKGVEIALVLLILLNGIGVNAVRMRRWSLAKALRTRTRDWSPLPITTSTNLALLDNAGLNAGHHFLGQPDQTALAERTRAKDVATLRWRMRETEGSWWLSYRPIIKCELVTPGSSGLIAYAQPPADDVHSTPDAQQPDEEGRAPAYEA